MSKYKAKRTEVDGIVFASQKEARRYRELKLLERAGEIRNLVLQPSYPLNSPTNAQNGADPIGFYYADFGYDERVPLRDARGRNLPGANGFVWKPTVEDVKGFKTPLYRWKKKHVEAQYGIQIRET